MRSRAIKAEVSKKIRKNLREEYRIIYDFMCNTGLRIGDAVCVKYGDIDRDGYLHYKAHKTGKIGKIKINDDILQRLGIKNCAAEQYIFPSPVIPGEHITRQAVWKNIKRACKRSGVDGDGISPHSCRKVFAVDTYDREGLGATMAKLQHDSPSTTFLYTFDENPFSRMEEKLKEQENEIKKLKKELKTVKKLIKEVLHAVDICCDALIGDDRYGVTEKGRKLYDDFGFLVEKL